jgi:hypothetical protein
MFCFSEVRSCHYLKSNLKYPNLIQKWEWILLIIASINILFYCSHKYATVEKWHYIFKWNAWRVYWICAVRSCRFHECDVHCICQYCSIQAVIFAKPVLEIWIFFFFIIIWNKYRVQVEPISSLVENLF